MTNKRFFAVVALAAVMVSALSGCDREESPRRPPGTVIARVGNAYLTLEELQASIPAEYSYVITRDQNIQYVRQWINTELLYQEAMRLGVDNEPVIKARLEKMRKDLLSAEIISRSAARGGAEVSEQAVREYYETHREQFVRDAFMVRYEEIVVDDINLAWELRRTATHETFRNMARAHSKFQNHGLHLDDTPPHVPIDAVPPVIRNAIMAAAVPSITGPYRAEDGFHIMRLIGRFERGTIASFEEVRDEIVARLSNITQKGETERLLSDIRARADVEFNMDQVPGIDTTVVADLPGAQD
jgi:hypothetical protein